MVFSEPCEKPLKLPLFACFEHVWDEAGNGEEGHGSREKHITLPNAMIYFQLLWLHLNYVFCPRLGSYL